MTADPTTTLAAHVVNFVEFDDGIETAVCLCGGRFNDTNSAYWEEGRISHPAHLLAVLAQEGWAVVRRDLLADLTDPDDCWFDHHGACQAHGCAEPPCPHQRAKDILANEDIL